MEIESISGQTRIVAFHFPKQLNGIDWDDKVCTMVVHYTIIWNCFSRCKFAKLNHCNIYFINISLYYIVLIQPCRPLWPIFSIKMDHRDFTLLHVTFSIFIVNTQNIYNIRPIHNIREILTEHDFMGIQDFNGNSWFLEGV